jgi:molybdate transport system substrate-binding protein
VEVLQDKNISKIAVANPKTAPYGKLSFEALEKEGVLDDIKGKFVYGESVSQTVSYTITATDIGIVAKSSLYSPKMGEYREGVNWISVDPKLYNPIEQGIVILKNGEGSREVASFYAFILSVRAEKILKNFGYIF